MIGASYAAALGLAILCGFMAPMINYAFAFGQAVANHAAELGSSPAKAAFAVWPVALAGGMLPNLGYSLYLLSKNGTWGFIEKLRGTTLASPLLGSCGWVPWPLYGVASVYLGSLGTSVGWGLFQIFMIITANLSGLLTGEWRGASPCTRKALCRSCTAHCGNSAACHCQSMSRREPILMVGSVAAIYKDRWQIELFFKALKQTAKVKSFLGTSANAVKTQIWTALIAMLILKYLQMKSSFGWSLSNLAALLRQQLFIFRDLWAWLNTPLEGPPAAMRLCEQLPMLLMW